MLGDKRLPTQAVTGPFKTFTATSVPLSDRYRVRLSINRDNPETRIVVYMSPLHQSNVSSVGTFGVLILPNGLGKLWYPIAVNTNFTRVERRAHSYLHEINEFNKKTRH